MGETDAGSLSPRRSRGRRRMVPLLVTALAVTSLPVTGILADQVARAAQRPAAEGEDLPGTVPLFDSTVAHTVKLSFADGDYQKMLDTYFASQEKDWVKADLVLDGTAISQVGIRLKGNSTLMSITRNGQGIKRPAPGATASPRAGAATDAGAARQLAAPAATPSPSATGGGGGWPGGGGGGWPGGGGGFGGLGSPIKAEEPETLPWLIRFDKFVKDRRYQGYKQIAVRAAGSGKSAAVNEAVSLTLLAQSGDPAQKYGYSSFTVNDRPTKLRLLLEEPGPQLSKQVGPNGVLYKSLNSATFKYQGEDLAAYEDDFKQITKEDTQTVKPVVDLVKWVTQATDQEFAAGLADHLDLASFARYVAFQNLTLNWDDMSGPGKNYFLWYDLDKSRFTVLTSDLNLTFSGSATQGPCEKGGFGGGFGGAGSGNPLKDRFLGLAAFRTTYAEAYRQQYQTLFGSGAAIKALDAVSAVLAGNPSADKSAVATEAASLRTLIQNRTTSLAASAVVKGGTCS